MLNERETNMFAFTKKSLSLFAKKILKEFKIFICKLKLFKKKNQQNSFCSFYFLFLFNDYCLNFDAKKQTLYLEIRGYLVLFLSCIHKHI